MPARATPVTSIDKLYDAAQALAAKQPAGTAVLVGASHPFPYQFDGYVFFLPKGHNWRTSHNDTWDITTVSPRVRKVGQRRVDGQLVDVFTDKSGNHYAACHHVSENARVGGRLGLQYPYDVAMSAIREGKANRSAEDRLFHLERLRRAIDQLTADALSDPSIRSRLDQLYHTLNER